MADEVEIFIDRQRLIGYTYLRLSRDKKDMTGEAQIDIFMGWIPESPVLYEATTGREVLIYIGGHLAFTGYIDRRTDASQNNTEQGSDKSQSSAGALSVGPNSYTVSFSCRGQTKYLIDSSQQHPTGTMLRPTNRSVFETLVAPWRIPLTWEAEVIELDKVRFRDGAAVSDELQRICEQCSLYMFETRDGTLRVMDGASATMGEPLVLGVNILQFSADQAVDPERSEVKVKGQLIGKSQWGVGAVLPTIQSVINSVVPNFVPTTVQLYGDGTDQLLQKRAQFEANKRSAAAKQITLTMFHVLQTDGQPWDLATLHYVEIPPAGIYGVFEVINLSYLVDTGQITTTLTLSPAPVKLRTDATSSGFLAEVPDVDDASSLASTRQAEAGLAENPTAWKSPDLKLATLPDGPVDTPPGFLSEVEGQTASPPLELPQQFTGAQ